MQARVSYRTEGYGPFGPRPGHYHRKTFYLTAPVASQSLCPQVDAILPFRIKIGTHNVRREFEYASDSEDGSDYGGMESMHNYGGEDPASDGEINNL